jgi:uncharacterized protein YbaP (TraB family)
MIKRLFLLVATAMMLAGCGEKTSEDLKDVNASPILYELADANGQQRGWLFGTIHSLPDDLQWRTADLNQAIDDADLLVVEIAELDNSAALFKLFTRLATTPNQPDIGSRVPASLRPELFALIEQSDYQASDFGDVETWAAALILAQASADRDSGDGADKIIIREFKGRPVEEFEGAELQLGIFDQLPERDQSDLLVGVIEEEKLRAADPTRLRRAWLAGDSATLEDATTTGLMADPELRAALLVNRNRDWTDKLVRILNRGDKPLVAVGAAHLVGPDGLPAMLEKHGFRVKQIN